MQAQDDTAPKLAIHGKKVLNSMEIERRFAKENNTLNALQKKWSRLKTTSQVMNEIIN